MGKDKEPVKIECKSCGLTFEIAEAIGGNLMPIHDIVVGTICPGSNAEGTLLNINYRPVDED